MADTTEIVCASCGVQLEGLARFCPSCGAAAPAMGSPGTGEGHVAALLASAAGALKRHEWVGAKEKCNQALLLEPENRSARALMGDIYFSQHLYKDALSWYRLAHDQDSGNSELLQKLQRTGALARSHPRSEEDDGERPSAWRERLMFAQALADSMVRNRSFLRFVGYLTVILAGLFFVAILTAAFVRKSDRTSVQVHPTYPSAQSGNTGSTPRPPQPSGPPYQMGTAPATAPAGKAQTDVATGTGGTTPQEANLLANLRTDPLVTRSGVDLQALWGDVRGHTVTLIVRTDAGSGRRTLLTKALDAARAVFAQEPLAQTVVVRINQPLADIVGNTSLQVAFIGDISRSGAARTLADDAPASSIEQLFANIYWHPNLRNAPQAASQAGATPAVR